LDGNDDVDVFTSTTTRITDVSVVEADNNKGDEIAITTILNSPPAAAAVDFARLIGRLKITPRTGWVRRGVPKYESVADHSWRVAALSFLLLNNNNNKSNNNNKDTGTDGITTEINNNNSNADESTIDVTKCIQLAVVHDIAECLVGDIAPDDNVAPDDKRQMEHVAVKKLASKLKIATSNLQQDETITNEHQQHQYLLLTDLYQEYEERQTKEAKAVKDLDLLDMIIQASEYEERFNMDLSDFFIGTPPNRFQNPTIRSIAEEVHKQRAERQNKIQLSTSSLSKSNSNSNTDASEVLTATDIAFVEEYAKASPVSSEAIEQILLAYKQWNK
jgi:putative hydrolase of HD superfamily